MIHFSGPLDCVEICRGINATTLTISDVRRQREALAAAHASFPSAITKEICGDSEPFPHSTHSGASMAMRRQALPQLGPPPAFIILAVPQSLVAIVLSARGSAHSREGDWSAGARLPLRRCAPAPIPAFPSSGSRIAAGVRQVQRGQRASIPGRRTPRQCATSDNSRMHEIGVSASFCPQIANLAAGSTIAVEEELL